MSINIHVQFDAPSDTGDEDDEVHEDEGDEEVEDDEM